jgi:hypothetical protein
MVITARDVLDMCYSRLHTVKFTATYTSTIEMIRQRDSRSTTMARDSRLWFCWLQRRVHVLALACPSAAVQIRPMSQRTRAAQKYPLALNKCHLDRRSPLSPCKPPPSIVPYVCKPEPPKGLRRYAGCGEQNVAVLAANVPVQGSLP